MTEYKRQGAIVRTSDGKQHGVVSDDDTQLLVRDLETDELRWVTISDVEFVTAASAMTRWEPDGDWKIHHDIFVRDARSFPTTDGDTLTPGDPVRSEGRHQILGTGAGSWTASLPEVA